jgi:GMP synthase (glutamine-hydrolysing)
LYIRPQIAILDFGSQYSHLIARRVRELHVYCELYSCLVSVEELSKHTHIVGIILSGGPASVYDIDAPHVHADVWTYIQTHRIPILGICYGMQELAYTFQGVVEKGLKHEYGKSLVKRTKHKPAVIDADADTDTATSTGTGTGTGTACAITPTAAETPLEETTSTSNHASSPSSSSLLFQDIPDEFVMWMSHGDKIQTVPEGFHSVAHTDNAEHVMIENTTTHMYGLQFHPEVTHSTYGKQLLRNFCIHIAQAPTNWIMMDYAQEFITSVRNKVGPTGHVLGAVSGGVDSTVAAILMTRAIGDRFHAVLVDNGCLRYKEAEQVLQRMKNDCGVNLRCVDASELFLQKLHNVIDPEQKRKIIGTTFIDVFQTEVQKMTAEENITCEYLLQGTLYPDVIESISYKGPSACIKTHHNVGGLPATMKLQLIEPLRELFKDEVRELGLALGIDEISIWRHPFPGPGLAIRVLGEVTKERIAIVQQADAILIDILQRTGHYKLIGQAFVVLLPVQSVGVMGDGRTYENVAAIRCVETTDYMTADFYHLPYDIMSELSSRIINEVRGINRICYDISSKPPATIEWE